MLGNILAVIFNFLWSWWFIDLFGDFIGNPGLILLSYIVAYACVLINLFVAKKSKILVTAVHFVYFAVCAFIMACRIDITIVHLIALAAFIIYTIVSVYKTIGIKNTILFVLTIGIGILGWCMNEDFLPAVIAVILYVVGALLVKKAHYNSGKLFSFGIILAILGAVGVITEITVPFLIVLAFMLILLAPAKSSTKKKINKFVNEYFNANGVTGVRTMYRELEKISGNLWLTEIDGQTHEEYALPIYTSLADPVVCNAAASALEGSTRVIAFDEVFSNYYSYINSFQNGNTGDYLPQNCYYNLDAKAYWSAENDSIFDEKTYNALSEFWEIMTGKRTSGEIAFQLADDLAEFIPQYNEEQLCREIFTKCAIEKFVEEKKIKLHPEKRDDKNNLISETRYEKMLPNGAPGPSDIEETHNDPVNDEEEDCSDLEGCPK